MENKAISTENSEIQLVDELLPNSTEAAGQTTAAISAVATSPIIDACATPNTEASSSVHCQKTANEATIVLSSDEDDAEHNDFVIMVAELPIIQPNADESENEAAADSVAAAGTSSNANKPLECPICLQSCIHPARLPCGHIFCFLCVKGVANKNRRCAMCRREIPTEFLDHPQLVYGIEDISTTKATDDGYQWYYEGRNGWWQYDDRTSQDIEEAYKRDEKSCTILVAGYVYIVDLEAMVQQRQNEPTRCRHVKRDLATIPKKGVAGLRIDGNTVATDSSFTASIDLVDIDNDSDSEIDLPRQHHHLTANAHSGVDFMSTIAATDAAIRLASDIIDSTLAHADEITRSSLSALTNAASLDSDSGELSLLHISDMSLGIGGDAAYVIAHGNRQASAAVNVNVNADDNEVNNDNDNDDVDVDHRPAIDLIE